MDEKFRPEAIRLANQVYTDEIYLDQTTAGEKIYFARTRELEGCVAQGKTIEEARENLLAARVDYTQSLLEDGLFVPPPNFRSIFTSGTEHSIIVEQIYLPAKSTS